MSSSSNSNKRKHEKSEEVSDESFLNKHSSKKSKNNKSPPPSPHHNHRHHHDKYSSRRDRDIEDDHYERRKSKESKYEDRDRREQRSHNNDRPEYGPKWKCAKREEQSSNNGQSDRPSWDNSKVKRHAEMLQNRKLLWKPKTTSTENYQTKDGQNSGSNEPSVSSTDAGQQSPTLASEKKLETKWTSMIAATAKDTEQMDKFQRLMGLKKHAPTATTAKSDAVASETSGQGTSTAEPIVSKDAIEQEKSRQEELQQKLNTQFEMARFAHHAARGRGLGSS